MQNLFRKNRKTDDRKRVKWIVLEKKCSKILSVFYNNWYKGEAIYKGKERQNFAKICFYPHSRLLFCPISSIEIVCFSKSLGLTLLAVEHTRTKPAVLLRFERQLNGQMANQPNYNKQCFYSRTYIARQHQERALCIGLHVV